MRLHKLSRQALFTFSVLSLFAINTLAQTPTGTVVGTIFDQNGAAIPSAHITISDVATGTARATASSPVGAYEFTTLRPSNYDITVEAPGFNKEVERNVKVAVGDVVRVDLKMQVGTTQEVVEVKAEATLIEPDKTSVSYGVDPNQIQSLPMLNRNFINLALITPGSLPQAPGTQAGGVNVPRIRAPSNNFTLDGVNNNDPQVKGPPDTLHNAHAGHEITHQTNHAGSQVGHQ